MSRVAVARRGLAAGPLSVPVRRRAVLVTLALVLVVAGVALQNLVTGELALPPDRILATLTGQGTGVEQLVVGKRLDRVAAALLVGAALGCSGGLTQTVTRNPIASPDVLGVTAGASAAAVAVLTLPTMASAATGDTGGIAALGAAELLAPAALAGGLGTTAVILLLARRGGFDGYRIVLVGLGVNAVALAFVSWLLTRAALESAQLAQRWLTGSLDGVTRSELLPLAAVRAGALAVCVVLADRLGALRRGGAAPAALGAPPPATTAWALVTAVLAASGAVAVAGAISFVAFVAPQLAMRLFRTAGPPPVAGALTGAALLLVADTAVQALPRSLPVGVVTSLIGAPFLLYVIASRRNRG